MGQRVVVIGEDDEPIAALLADCVNDEPGYRAVVVDDGAVILETLRHEHADLLILDIMMPGLSGFEVYDSIQANEALQHVPVLFVSAAATQYDDELQRRNITDVIHKPFDLDELIQRVRAICPPHDLAEA
jgi:DNA-binding response OmpR family regulator